MPQACCQALDLRQIALKHQGGTTTKGCWLLMARVYAANVCPRESPLAQWSLGILWPVPIRVGGLVAPVCSLVTARKQEEENKEADKRVWRVRGEGVMVTRPTVEREAAGSIPARCTFYGAVYK